MHVLRTTAQEGRAPKLLNQGHNQHTSVGRLLKHGNRPAIDDLAGEVPDESNQKVDMCRCAAAAGGRPRALCTSAGNA